MKKRIDYIDTARGIAMLLVILGHCCSSTTGVVNRTILSFHMPLFFFLSGVFAKNGTLPEFWGGVCLKAKKLLIPQIVLGLTIIPLKCHAWLAEGNSLSDFNFFQGFLYWFLPTLFLCSVLHLIITCFADIKRRIIQTGVLFTTIAIALCTQYFIGNEDGVVYVYLRIIPVAFLFYELGNYTKSLTESLQFDKNGMTGLIVLMSVPLLVILSQWNEPVKMYIGHYGSNFILFLLTSIIGTGIIIGVSKIANLNILRELGRISIALYTWNFLIIGLTKGILRRILEVTGLFTDVALAATTFVISVIILYGISKMTMKYIPFIYGQKK